MIKILGFFSMIAAAYGSVADIEILLAVITSIGIAFSVYNLRESTKDWIVQRRQKPRNSARVLVALNGFRNELARLLIQVWFLTLSIIAMTIPETPPYVHEPLKLIVFGFIFRWGIIGASLLLSLKSYWGWQIRHQVIEKLEDDDLA